MIPDQSAFSQSVQKYRHKTYRYDPGNHIKSESQAVDFVNQRKFVFFWPIKGIPLPSLWCATAGNRPVPNNHDDPGHITWRWKDNLLGKGHWYYAKVLRRKSTIIALTMLEYFFALTGTAFHTIEDLEYLHRIGKQSQIEIEIFSLLLSSGPLDAITIRDRLKTSLAYSSAEFNRAMEKLQSGFHILPTGIANTGRWHYAYLYDTVEHIYPQKLRNADKISKEKARQKILSAYFLSNGAAAFSDIKKLFHWKKPEISLVLDQMQQNGFIRCHEKANDSVYFIQELLV